MAYRIKLDGTTLPTFDIGLNKVKLSTAGTTGPWTLTLPTGPGQAGYVLQTDGNGITDWVSVTGATSDQTPYYLGPTETFTVYPNKQVLFSREITVDGELNVDGDLIQVNGGAVDILDSMMPYYIEPGLTYRIPLYKQGLFTIPIEVDGDLQVDGILVGV